jgi:hypothetical protein
MDTARVASVSLRDLESAHSRLTLDKINPCKLCLSTIENINFCMGCTASSKELCWFRGLENKSTMCLTFLDAAYSSMLPR